MPTSTRASTAPALPIIFALPFSSGLDTLMSVLLGGLREFFLCPGKGKAGSSTVADESRTSTPTDAK